MEIIFATHNPNKVKEIALMIPDGIQLLSLKDINFQDEIEEPYKTLEENSLAKADTIWQQFQKSVIAEDTGLEVTALDNQPGVYSARFAGKKANAEKNMQKLLSEMEGITNRTARFRTVLTFILNADERYQFEGIINGHISLEKSGDKGFGYDPIFIPESYQQSFGELPAEIKQKISHRAMAVKKFIEFLNSMQDRS